MFVSTNISNEMKSILTEFSLQICSYVKEEAVKRGAGIKSFQASSWLIFSL
jgi:hypothetical protein